jgi:nucleotide-binding universal stress UspA family protein
MDEIVEECRESHEATFGSVRTGTPFLEIINSAKDLPADLVVMGTHGRTGLKHMLIGSVAEKVVRKSPCPVLTVKHPHHEFEMP